jgi:adenylate cyclase
MGVQTYNVRPFYAYASMKKGLPQVGLENKLVLVGAFSNGMAADEKTTPRGLMFGVEIHANALNTIIKQNFIHEAPLWLSILILILFVGLISFLTGRFPTYVGLIALIAGIILYFFITVSVFDFSDMVLNITTPIFSAVFAYFLILVYRLMTEEKDKRMIRNMFGKYVSPKVVDQILASPPELGGVDKELSVLFSDIRGFTTLSETMTPQELVGHLNLYLTAMTDTIMEYYGTLDKYVGDEIMCFWGAPINQADHAIRACKCALKQMEVLAQLNAGWPVEKRIDIGIGVNSGIMTVGNMGSLGRMNYTLMGDNVNLGARLEGTNKTYKTHIIISEYTYGLVKDKVIVRELDNIRVKGKNKPVIIYELVDVVDTLEIEEDKELKK